MYIDQNSFSDVMEDFVDILMDYDIACEGFINSTKNMISKAIDFIIKLFKDTFNIIRKLFKRKPKKADEFEDFYEDMLKDLERREEEIKKSMERGKKLDEEIDAQMDNFIKKGPSVTVYNWNLNQLPQAFDAAFNMFKFEELFSIFPVYSNALQSNDSESIAGVKEKLLNIYSHFSDELDSIEYKSFVAEPEKVTLDTKTAEGVKEVKHFVTIASVIQNVEKVVEGKEPKIMGQLSKFKKQVNDITLSADFSKGDMQKKQEITRTMTRIMTYVNKETTSTLRFLTDLINKLTADFNKIVSSFIRA